MFVLPSMAVVFSNISPTLKLIKWSQKKAITMAKRGTNKFKKIIKYLK
jgi:hypothetical protein